MAARRPCRVQWVASRPEMNAHLAALERDGAILLGRSAFEASTSDLDLLGDPHVDGLSIAEVTITPEAFADRVAQVIGLLERDLTILLDLSGPRPRVQCLPVAGRPVVILLDQRGARRIEHPSLRTAQEARRQLLEQLN